MANGEVDFEKRGRSPTFGEVLKAAVDEKLAGMTTADKIHALVNFMTVIKLEIELLMLEK